MSNKETFTTPVGRLVQGSLYEPQTTDAEGKPLAVKTGPNAGQPRVEYYFALAIAKAGEKHWSETEWGAIIHKVGVKGFPGGQANHRSFAWKIIDGDSTEVNKANKRPCDREGYPGHWVLNFSSGFAPAIYNEDGTKTITEPGFVALGYFIQVHGNVSDNGSTQQPGVFLNHAMVAFAGYGTRIIVGPDPKSVGFGKGPKPAGVMASPPGGGFNPASAPAPVSTTPPPHPGILNPAGAKAHVMLPPANGASYEQMIAAGWNDAQLIQHGMMQG
jgi:hypothetical protein